MSHHYGRHGPRAWLHWRKRHYRSSLLPTIVKTEVVVIRAYIPVNAERIIFIIMGDEYFNENGQMSGQIQVIRDPSNIPVDYVQSSLQNTDGILKLSSSDNILINEAQWRAFHDARDIESLIKKGNFVRIDRSKVENRIEDIVNTYLEKSSSNAGPPPSKAEYRRLVKVCSDAYWVRFEEEIGYDQDGINYIGNSEEARIRAVAILDKKGEPSRSYRDYHIRDLAVIRVLQELNIPLDIATDRLSEIHALADKYQEYYANPREEVDWPNQMTF